MAASGTFKNDNIWFDILNIRYCKYKTYLELQTTQYVNKIYSIIFLSFRGEKCKIKFGICRILISECHLDILLF